MRPQHLERDNIYPSSTSIRMAFRWWVNSGPRLCVSLSKMGTNVNFISYPVWLCVQFWSEALHVRLRICCLAICDVTGKNMSIHPTTNVRATGSYFEHVPLTQAHVRLE